MTSVSYPEPHCGRTQRLFREHPEVAKLVGRTPSTAFYVIGIVLVQCWIAAHASGLPFWVLLLLGYTVGAFLNHALWVLIHETAHNLVFKKTASNSLLAIIANLPIIFPSALSFRTYHLKHHQYQGELDRDADLPRPFEVRWVKNSSFRKSMWHLLYFIPQIVRVFYLKGIQFLSPWIALNGLAEVSFLAAMIYWTGWNSFIYLALSSVFSIGFHPLGARWIQEHYVVHENQETYSYYGPLNRVAFNVGYHNEHHDMMGVPWNRLPELKRLAPEFYDTLYSHRSWVKLWVHFLTDPRLGLFSRITRPSAAVRRSEQMKTTSCTP